MSDIAGAAAAMGVPEALVKRSAEARAKATGVSVDEILAAWAGGSAAPAGAPTPLVTAPVPTAPTDQTPIPPTTTSDAEEGGSAPDAEAPTPQIGTVPPAQPIPVSRAAAGAPAPPVLVGAREGLGVVLTGSVGLLILSLLLAVFLPSLQQPGNGIRSSNHAFSSEARDGQQIYLSQGCATCHTQLVRNLVTDVGLGPVTLDDTNQIIGFRRIGPDVSAIGGRIEDTAALTALVTGGSNHPAATGLSEAEIASLLAYLRESR